jgi:predicted HTH domain antitoxin
VSKKITGVRLDSELTKAVDEVVEQESVDKSTALRKLVGEGYRGWRLKRALQQLREGKVSVWEASRTAGLPLWDFLALLKKEEGVEWVEFDLEETLSKRH